MDSMSSWTASNLMFMLSSRVAKPSLMGPVSALTISPMAFRSSWVSMGISLRVYPRLLPRTQPPTSIPKERPGGRSFFLPSQITTPCQARGGRAAAETRWLERQSARRAHESLDGVVIVLPHRHLRLDLPDDLQHDRDDDEERGAADLWVVRSR